MAVSRAVAARTRRPAGLKDAVDSAGKPAREPDDLPDPAQEIARYLGNGFLEAVAGQAALASTGRGPDADTTASATWDLSPAPPGTLQPKLAVGAARDAFEREADRLADLLMHRAEAHLFAPAPDPEAPPRAKEAPVRVSRQTPREIDKGMDVAPDIAARMARMRHGGFPLPARERALFEPLLGVDLGSIRIHTGVGAIETARALNARAYAVGSDIAFGSGQYRPGTDSGRRLLAHELVHTVQQRGSIGPVRRDSKAKTAPVNLDVTPATGQQEQFFVPPAAPIKQHLKVVAEIDNDQWILTYEETGKLPPPGEPGYLVITPSGNAYAFVGDEPDTAHPKTFQAHPDSLPPFGFYLNIPERRWSGTQQRSVDRIHLTRYTTRDRFMPTEFRESVSVGDKSFSVKKKFFWVSNWFGSEDWAELEKLWSGTVTRLYLIVVPDPPEETDEKSKHEPGGPPEWVKKQQQNVKEQLKEARPKGPRRDTPDQIEVWNKESTGQWWMIVTVHLDAAGKERASVPIPLRRGEKPDDLMARIKGATQRGLCQTRRANIRKAQRAGAQVGARSQEGVVARARAAAQAGARQRGLSRSADA